MAFRPQRVRDPLHNLIEFEANEFECSMWDVIQTRPFQRLRRIKQLGFSDLVYPGATHSRLAHSIGVFHTARQLLEIVRKQLGESRFSNTKAQNALAAALVHDLGHGPFSHAFEKVGEKLKLKMAIHENVSDALIRDGEVATALNKLGSGFANDVAEIIKSRGPRNIYDAIVSSQFDADRLDYMRRDRLMTGSHHAEIDFQWLMSNLEIGEVETGVDDRPVGKVETFVLGSKAVFAAEAYVLGLFQLYPTIYFHKATRSAEKLFTELILRCVELVRDGNVQSTGLSPSHPLVKFANSPENINCALALDDAVIWGALSMMTEAADPTISEFSKRLRDRRLFKAIDVREHVKLKLDAEVTADSSVTRRVDQTCARIMNKVHFIAEGKKENGGLPRIIVDHAERDPYKPFQESKGPLNQIQIKLPSGTLIDLEHRSNVVNSIDSFKLDRVYIAHDDIESRSAVESIMREEVKNDGSNEPEHTTRLSESS
jgi:HD superfamily phosphohydrolase